MINVSSEELGLILSKIEDSLVLHDKWREELQRTIACRLSPAEADLAEDAHVRCAFGHWLYSKGNSHLLRLQAFRIIERMHIEMHDSARDVCLKIKTGRPVAIEDYDDFMHAAANFRGELANVGNRVSFTLNNIDPLTGALKQSQLLPELRQEQKRLKETGESYSLLLIDLDIKEINARHGRAQGDKVLREAIAGVRSALSAQDKIYRLVGAEFVISLPGKATGEAESVKEKLLRNIETTLVAATGTPKDALDIHYGIIALEPHTFLEELLDQAARITYTLKI